MDEQVQLPTKIGDSSNYTQKPVLSSSHFHGFHFTFYIPPPVFLSLSLFSAKYNLLVLVQFACSVIQWYG